MKKFEILAPAGDFDCLKAAILSGCDAVYLGGKCFGARAYSGNFSNEELSLALEYAHLRGVFVYVAVNTLISDLEVEEFLNYIGFLYGINVDAVIMQDIGMIDLVRQKFPDLEVHISTQAHVHTLNGVNFFEKLGVSRVVLGREVSISEIKEIKSKCDIPLEVFVHGSLCVSYSGQCLFSSIIGNRSGNFGKCAGTCRMKYSTNKDAGYLLSMKDLNILDKIGELIDIGVESFKIEGRMKSPMYVYYVTKLYRCAVDSYLKTGVVSYDESDLYNLKKVFNREYTNGYLFDSKDVINKYRPNHLGIKIGEVIDYKNGNAYIKLCDDLSVLDGIRIVGKFDVGFNVLEINEGRVKSGSNGDVIFFKCDYVEIGSDVLKTNDYLLNLGFKDIMKLDKKIKIDIFVSAKLNEKLVIKMFDGKNEVICYGDMVQSAINQGMTYDRIFSQVSKLGDSVYVSDNVDIDMSDNIFIVISHLNEVRRKCIKKLDDLRIGVRNLKENKYNRECVVDLSNSLNVLTDNYEMVKDYDFDNIYLSSDVYDLVSDSRKVLNLGNIKNTVSKCMIGEIGGISEGCITDYTLNVYNSYSVCLLHNLGVKRITLSLELNYDLIKVLICEFKKRYGCMPNLELVIYGRQKVMTCKNILSGDYLIDKFSNKYPLVVKDGYMDIYNCECNILSDINKYKKIGISNFRIDLIGCDSVNSSVVKLFAK